MVGPRQKSIVDEEVFLNGEPWITPLEVSHGVVQHPVTERQVLRTGGGADRVRLYESELADRLAKGGGLEQRTRDGVAA